MIDKELVIRKIDLIQRDLQKLEKFRDYTFDEIAKDYYMHKAVERMIEVVINEALDINQHILAQSKFAEAPYDYEDSFLKLTDLDVYPEGFAKKICKSAGLRNILVHQYCKLDEEKFYHSIKECLRQYTKYSDYILKFLEKV